LLPPEAGGNDQKIKMIKGERVMKHWMVRIFILSVLLGLTFTACSGNDDPLKDDFAGKERKTVALGKTINRTLMKVDKLSCGACLTAISQKLSTLEGVAGLRSDLSQGLVAVDHTKTLESKRIADAITSIGYPATILSVTEVDSRSAFDASNSGSYGGSCCGSSGSSIEGTNGKDNGYSSGCPYSGSVRSRGCYASSDSWKELYEKFVKRSKNTKK